MKAGFCPRCGALVPLGQTASGYYFCYCGWTASVSVEEMLLREARRKAPPEDVPATPVPEIGAVEAVLGVPQVVHITHNGTNVPD